MPDKVDIEAIRAALRRRSKGKVQNASNASKDKPLTLDSGSEKAAQMPVEEAPEYTSSVAYVTIHKGNGFSVRYDLRTGESTAIKDLSIDQD